jgi:hypothetical protein
LIITASTSDKGTRCDLLDEDTKQDENTEQREDRTIEITREPAQRGGAPYQQLQADAVADQL